MMDIRDSGAAEVPENYLLNRYQRLSELVTQQIIEWIVNGTLKAGQRLTAEDLASKLGVSRSPVREALRVLEAGGYLESAPYRGTWVKQLTAQEIEEVYMLREMLEGKAAYFAAQRITPREIEELERINRAIAECVEKGDRIRQQELNKEFHFTLYAASGKPRLYNLIRSLWDSIAYYRLLYSKSRSKGHQTQQEHQAFIEALKAGDAEGVQRLVSATIRRHAQEMIDLVAEASGESRD
ncbi:MAG: GntR family transcriptional regulator [Bacillota bacterium]|nr:GntR family transcriptional regulator [Bacillota bacterium]